MKPNLLVIDDESRMGRLFERLLGERFEVSAATSADLALEIVAHRDFDVIFCDLNMPRASGIECYRRLAKTRPGQQQRVVFFTGGFVDGQDQAFIDDLDNPLLFKPFDIDELEEALESAMDGDRQRGQSSGNGDR